MPRTQLVRQEISLIERSPVLTVPPRLPVDAVYATAVLGSSRLLARFYWGRSNGFNKPLILLDFVVEPLVSRSWATTRERLDALTHERSARLGRPLGLWVEGESLAAQARDAGIDTRPVPPHLVRDEAWHSMVQSAAAQLSQDQVGYTARAKAAMEARPFLNSAGVAAGPRTDDPTVPAFLYGIVIGLDEVLARDPHPRPPAKARR